MVPTVKESQEKIKGSGKVRKFKSTMVQKLTKMQKKCWTFIRSMRTLFGKSILTSAFIHALTQR